MADPASYRPKTSEIPTSPGVYRFRDESGRVIYVGKAKNLRNRLTSYFQDLSQLHPRTQNMVTSAASVQWTVVGSEVEALTLEYSWIKEFNPRFNVMFKDDKSYPYFAVTMGEEYPRMMVMRGARSSGTRYFGPYTQVWAIRETLDLLERVFPIRTCSAGVFRRAAAQGRPCLNGYIGRCSAPCTGRISAAEHRKMAADVCDFMSGKVGPFLRDLEAKMWQASADFDFETAAKLRDDLAALKKVLERNAVVLDDGTDADVFALVADEIQASIQVFHVRGGRIRGQRGWVSNRTDEADEAALMQAALEQIYAEASPEQIHAGRGAKAAAPTSVDDVVHTPTSAIPRQVLVSHLPPSSQVLAEWLSQKRGAKVSVQVPARGPKRELMDTVRANAEEALRVYKTRRASDLTQRSLALQELGQTLGIDAPLRIECYDVSHTQGTYQMASMVVFEDGAPRKNAYRKFAIRGPEGQGTADDTSAMSEVLERRFRRLAAEEAGEAELDGEALESGPVDAETGRPRRFSYRPDLVVVDGGIPQVNAARAAMDRAGAWDIPVVGLAKRLEEVWVVGDDFPVIFPRLSPALYLLQYLRDESHRFAITAHRKKRSQAMVKSVLDEVPGLGPTRQKDLLRHFGSLKQVRAATVVDLEAVKGIGPALAQVIFQHLHPAEA